MGLNNNQSIGGNRRSLNGLSGGIRRLGVKYDVDYQAVLSRAVALGYTLPSLARRKKESDSIVAMKAAGIWAKLDIFYNFWTDGSDNFSMLNWKAPTLYQAGALNAMVFTPLQGWKGDGISAYMTTNFNASINGANYTLNSAGKGSWIFQTPTGSAYIDGTTGASNTNALINSSTSNHRINTNTALSAIVNMTGLGFKSQNRISSTTVTFRNATLDIVGTQIAAPSMFNSIQFILRSNNAYGTSGISSYWMGTSLDLEAATFETILTTLYS